MSNLGDFSPFKRSYQFIHFQNSAYHLRNKKQIKPVINTNIKKRHEISNKSKQHTEHSLKHKISQRYTRSQTKIKEQSTGLSISFRDPYRVIHKNEIFERAKSAKIDKQNRKLVKKLIDTDCLIVSKSTASDNFQRHRKLANMIRKYQENGERHTTPIINLKNLNPALADFKSSRVASARNRVQGQQCPQDFVFNWEKE